MRIREDALRTVVFIGIEVDNGPDKKNHWCGTGFLVSLPSKKFDGPKFIYLVTAKHVLAGLSGKNFFIRANTTDGHAQINVSSDIKFFLHPNTVESADVAVYPLLIDREGFKNLSYAAIDVSTFATDEVIQSADIGIGDEIFIVGLFTGHAGSDKNLPIIRMGNIAMIPDEPVATSTFGNLEVYLIESRSLSGLSGSPVFVLKQTDVFKWRAHLLGLVHGHWEYPAEELTGGASKKVHSGISMVFPAKRILETILQPALDDVRRVMEDIWAKEHPEK